ncbi:MAG: TAXI family TRAP transporter solute-binding subunit [Bacteriovoracaceae bacterium]|nr:TAXI family TRAP transporter solute-binding subunit [Bacteriovoracaceae bacterium]
MYKMLVFLFSALILTGCDPNKNKTLVTIGTGETTGIYYPTGGAIASMINKKFDQYKIKADCEATEGSVYNINAVLQGDFQFGIVQSDRQYQAWRGEKEWKEKGPQTKLRSVFSIHPESVTLIASIKSEIYKPIDLPGKRVNIGNPGSGQFGNSSDTLHAFSLDKNDIIPEYVKAEEALGLLQNERIDAFFYTVGHPNGNIQDATTGKIKVRFIQIIGRGIEELIQKYPYYANSIIPHKMYPGAMNDEDIKTFGVKATLVTSVDVDEKIVYAITKEIFDNLEEFKKLHPAYIVLNKKDMLTGLSAPLHPGAIRYYKESGLIGFADKKITNGEKSE